MRAHQWGQCAAAAAGLEVRGPVRFCMVKKSKLAAGQAMELLGPSLWDEWNARGAGSMPVPFVACVAVEALRILEGLHERGCAPVVPGTRMGAPEGLVGEVRFLLDPPGCMGWTVHGFLTVEGWSLCHRGLFVMVQTGQRSVVCSLLHGQVSVAVLMRKLAIGILRYCHPAIRKTPASACGTACQAADPPSHTPQNIPNPHPPDLAAPGTCTGT